MSKDIETKLFGLDRRGSRRGPSQNPGRYSHIDGGRWGSTPLIPGERSEEKRLVVPIPVTRGVQRKRVKLPIPHKDS